MKRGYVDTPEGQVHYREEGTGEPLLLLHKAGLSSDEFTEMLPFLGKKIPGGGDGRAGLR